MKPLLIIDPGHGGTDPGGGSSEYFEEKVLVLEISRYQAERFKQLGLSVALTREKDEYLDSGNRTAKVRNSGAMYCISNHINAADNPSARGVETIHSLRNDSKLATAIFRAIVDEGMTARRVFTRALPSGKDYYFMHRETGSVTTIIVEYGFATNDEDAKLLVKHWRDYAEAVVRAFCAHIDHPYNPPAQPQEVKELPNIQQEIGVEVDGKDAGSGYLIGAVSYIPARVVAEQLGAAVSWDGKSVIINKELK